jgi:hypothetical protein
MSKFETAETSPLDTPLQENTLSRRDMLRSAIATSAIAGTATGLAPAATADARFSSRRRNLKSSSILGKTLAENPLRRSYAALRLRDNRASVNQRNAPRTAQPTNDDEVRLPDFIGNFHKTLVHNDVGEVSRRSYLSYIDALSSGEPDKFDNIRVGRPNDAQRQRLVSPQAAFAFEMSGQDGQASRVQPAPAFDGLVTEAEMGEMYWYSATRDVPFINYETSNRIQRAISDLDQFTRSDIFPKDSNGDLTPQTVFRGGIPLFEHALPGALDGPFVSQFLVKDFSIGQLNVEQRYPKLVRSGPNQFMTNFDEWLAIQRGLDPNANGNPTRFTDRVGYICRMRDLSEWVHRDFPVQSPLHALSVIFGFGTDDAFDPNLPYLRVNNTTQQGFTTFGLADITHLTVHGPRQALTGAWFQKWLNHRRARPEVYGGRLNVQLRGLRDYGLGGELLDSEAFRVGRNQVRRANSTPGDASNDGLLAMGFPEGSPAHPAYPGGHSSFVAAGATILKAFVNEDFVIPDPVMSNADGSALLPYSGTLTIGGELNKLVSNVTHARDAAGMHWRSDGVGNLIGEAVGIALLADYSTTYNERFDGFTLTKFNGERINIRDGVVRPA